MWLLAVVLGLHVLLSWAARCYVQAYGTQVLLS